MGSRHWALTGALAGLGFAGTALALRLLTPWPSYLDLAGERLVAATPGAAFDALLERLQHWGKPALLLGLIALTLIAWLAVGWLHARLAGSRRSASRAWSSALGLALGLWALVSWAAGAFAQPWPASAQGAGSGLLSFALAALILGAFGARPSLARPRVDTGRRQLLAGLAAVAALADGALVWRLVSHMLEPPSSGAHVAGAPASTSQARPEAELFASVDGLMPQVTDNDTFYRISKNFLDPTVPAETWSLEVFGLIDQPQSLNYAQVRELPAVDETVTLECVSNLVGGPLVGNAVWTGVRLSTVLNLARVRPDAKFVAFSCSDNYTESYPLEKALAESTILAYAMNGEPLPRRHGFPLRVISTGRYGMKNPKWLRKIELTSSPRPGHWERQGWDDDAVVQTMSRIDAPVAGVPLLAGEAVLGGIAFAGERGISKVEVSVDGGSSWQAAVIDQPAVAAAWTRWVWRWPNAAPGRYQVLVRATDGAGALQTAERRASFPAGGSGYDHVEVVVQ